MSSVNLDPTDCALRFSDHRCAVLLAIAIAQDNLKHSRIHVFHAQTQAFHQSQTTPAE